MRNKQSESSLPISALVASCNEGFLLEDCLKSLQFCDEIFFVDLSSTDNSMQIAEQWTDKQTNYKRVDLIEEIHPIFIPQLKNDWILLIDPDERIDSELAIDIRKFFNTMPEDCGKINVPILYYYKNKPLKGTVWGGNKYGRLLIKRSANNIGNNVHTAIQLKNGFLAYKIKRKGNNVDHHYWVQSFDQMLEKHKRYVAKEGKSRFDNGDRYTFINHLSFTLGAFKECFWDKRGIKDGFTGLFLSFFYAWYVSSSWVSLKKYESLKK